MPSFLSLPLAHLPHPPPPLLPLPLPLPPISILNLLTLPSVPVAVAIVDEAAAVGAVRISVRGGRFAFWHRFFFGWEVGEGGFKEGGRDVRMVIERESVCVGWDAGSRREGGTGTRL